MRRNSVYRIKRKLQRRHRRKNSFYGDIAEASEPEISGDIPSKYKRGASEPDIHGEIPTKYKKEASEPEISGEIPTKYKKEASEPEISGEIPTICSK
ncbi:hypothetical protein [Niallia oryzisoli]|uniref:hypothetical protein n=1 Tax=Niallia oryzisoli TaxID=1737571 RepID=UPI003734C365